MKVISKKEFKKDFLKRASFSLPIETAILVPSTKNINEKLSYSGFRQRVDVVQEFLAKLFGGFSATSVVGGFYSDKTGKVVIEDVVKVVSFSTSEDFNTNRTILFKQIIKWKKAWSQQSIGVEHEGDLYYI